MATITINGVTYSGNNISINNGKMTIDGVDASNIPDNVMTIKVEGILNSLTCDKSVNVNGTIQGNIEAKGSVNCDDVKGNVNAGGSVNCDDIGGNVNAGGSINHG